MADLIIISWNANGLLQHGDELIHYVTNSAIKPQVICIQESNLYSKILPVINSYCLLRHDRINKRGGGLCIYIHSSISYTSIDPFNDNSIRQIEAMGITCSYKNLQFNITNIYCPPNVKVTKKEICNLKIDKNHLLMGDFNAKHSLWGSPKADLRGRILHDFFCLENPLICLNTGQGTRLNPNGKLSHIDIVFASGNLAAKINTYVGDDNWGSDHYPIIICYKGPETKIEEDPIDLSRPPSYNYKKANWKKYKEEVEFHLLNRKVDDATSCLVISTQILQEGIIKARELSVPKIDADRQHFKHKSAFWNENCTNAIQARRRAEKRFRLVESVQNKIDYKKAKAKVKYTIKQAKMEYWNNISNTFNRETKLGSIWTKVKKLNGTDSSNSSHYPSLDDKFLMTNSQIANCFAKNFQYLSSNLNVPQESLNLRQQILSQNPKFSKPIGKVEELIKPFTREELEETLGHFKGKTSSGPNSIGYPLLLNLPSSGVNYLLDLYNLSLKSGMLPLDWKAGWIKPILKPGKNKTDPLSYRQICLGNTIAKVIEKMIANRLGWYLTSNKLINQNQLGFLKGFSSTDQVARVVHDAKSALRVGNTMITVCIDFTRAFDLVWIDGLILKLRSLQIPRELILWITSFLKDRKYQVKIENSLSEPYSLDNGTPQGSCLSPILFLIMINDFPMLPWQVSSGIFADDSSIWKAGNCVQHIGRCLQEAMDCISRWCTKWGFVINTDKTEAIMITKRKNLTPPDIYVMGKKIKFKQNVKMLGITIDSKLSWKDHINNIKTSTDKCLNILRQLIHNEWSCNTNSLVTFVKGTIFSRIDYGDFLYADASKQTLKILDSIVYKALILASRGHRGTSLAALLSECGVKNLDTRRKHHYLNFLGKLYLTENKQLQQLLGSKNLTAPATSLDTKLWSDLKKELSQYDILDKLITPSYGLQPPWSKSIDKVDLSLSQLNLTSLEVTLYKSCCYNYLEKYKQDTGIFVDASVNSSDLVGLGLYIPDLELGLDFKVNCLISTYAAELYAIWSALKYCISNNIVKAVIYSDCLHVLKDIKRGYNWSNSNIPRPQLIQEAHHLVITSNLDLTLVWIPGNIGLEGHNRAHSLAKWGANFGPKLEVKVELGDIKNIITKHIAIEWFKAWNNIKTGNEYKQIMGLQVKQLNTPFLNHRDNINLTRLRLCCINSNYYNNKIGMSETPLCSYCNKIDDINHLIFDCILHGRLHHNLSSLIKQHSLNKNIKTILSNKYTIKCITDYIRYKAIYI